MEVQGAAQAATCPRHPGEKVIGRCSNCGGPICLTCRQAHGYFCNEECKRALVGDAPETDAAEAEEQAKIAEFRVHFDRWLRIAKRYVLPPVAALVAIVVIYKVTSRAGEVVWEFTPSTDRPLSRLRLHAGTIYVGCDDCFLHAVDSETGEVRWKYKTEKGLARSRPLVAPRGKVRKGGPPRVCITRDRVTMYAVNASKGKLAWKYPLPGDVPDDPVAGSEVVCLVADFYKDPSPAEKARLMGESYYSVSGPLSAHDIRIKTGSAICALDLRTGKELWRKDIEKGLYPDSLAVRAGTVYYSYFDYGEDGSGQSVLALDHRTGKGKWKAAIARSGMARLTATAKGILVASSESMFFISPEGSELWRGTTDRMGWRPVVSGKSVYCMRGGRLTCVDVATGKKRWAVKGSDSTSRPVPGGGLVFMSSFVEKKIERKKSDTKGPGFPTYKTPGVEDIVEKYAALARRDTKLVPTLHAMDAATGTTRWKTGNVGGEVLCSKGRLLAVDIHVQFLGQVSIIKTVVRALEPESGDQLWEHVCDNQGRSWAVDGERFYLSASSGVEQVSMRPGSRGTPPKSNVLRAISIGR